MVFNQHIRLYGVTSLLSGMPATMTRDALVNIGFFAIAPILKEKIKPYIESESGSTMICGPISGTIAAFTSQPFDAIRIHQQISLEKKKISSWQAVKEIIKTSGYSGFLKGATPRITRVISSVTIIYNINNGLMNYFYPDNANSSGPHK